MIAAARLITAARSPGRARHHSGYATAAASNASSLPPGPNPEWVYIANSDSLVRVPYKNGDLKASAKPQRIVERIPWVHHWARDVVVSPDGKRIFYSVGSGSNVALDMFPVPLDAPFEEWKKSHPLGASVGH